MVVVQRSVVMNEKSRWLSTSENEETELSELRSKRKEMLRLVPVGCYSSSSQLLPIASCSQDSELEVLQTSRSYPGSSVSIVYVNK